jgi:prepilin-type N-terminal cleavage/methylation domain-containing protein
MKQKGFTLIELLVVISIIGLLASVVLVALNGARQKARVAKRVADLHQLASALEMYYSDNNSYPFTNYPNVGYRSACTSWGGLSSNQVVWDVTLGKGLVPNYITSFPADPSMTQPSQNCFMYVSNGTDYKLMDYNITDMTLAQINQNPSFKDPYRDGATTCGGSTISNPDTLLSLAIFTPGGQCW